MRVLELANLSIRVFSAKFSQESIYDLAQIYFIDLKPEMHEVLFDATKNGEPVK